MNTYEQNINTWLNDNSIYTTIENHVDSITDQYPVNNIQIRLDDSIKTLKYLIKIQTNRFKEIVKNKLLWIYPSWI
jgi:hypothetical protein